MSGQKKVKVLIVGLPLFAKRLKEDLETFDKVNKYYCLDTYYNRNDRIKALLLLPFVDVIYSINGSLSKSKVFDIAFKLKKRVMMTWVGTDVSKAKKEPHKNQLYLTESEHYCEVEWIQNELKELNIDAKIQNFFNFKTNFEAVANNSTQLNVLTYISKNREEYYGWNELRYIAEQNPTIQFTVVGTDGIGTYPNNINCLGWQKDMNEHFNKAHVTVRFVQHDGLSGFVLESLIRGKQVIYSKPLAHCLYAQYKEDIHQHIQQLNKDLLAGKDLFNHQGRDFVLSNFNTETILSTLVANFSK